MDELKEQVIRHLLSVLKCPTCRHTYLDGDLRVVNHAGDTWYFNLTCSFCGARNLVAAVVKDVMTTQATDLTPLEMDKDTRRDVVDANDVLSIHYFLEEFDGDFTRLFGHNEAGNKT